MITDKQKQRDYEYNGDYQSKSKYTSSQWVELLSSAQIDETGLTLLKEIYSSFNHAASLLQLSVCKNQSQEAVLEEYEQICKELGTARQFKPETDASGQDYWWYLFFWGKNIKEVGLELKLHPELSEAIGQLFPALEQDYYAFMGDVARSMQIRYTPEDAVWIASAVLLYEKYYSNPGIHPDDILLMQYEIQSRAQKIYGQDVHHNTITRTCNADERGHHFKYLRDIYKYYRVPFPGEFGSELERPDPESVDYTAYIYSTLGYLTLNNLYSFIESDYAHLFDPACEESVSEADEKASDEELSTDENFDEDPGVNETYVDEDPEEEDVADFDEEPDEDAEDFGEEPDEKENTSVTDGFAAALGSKFVYRPSGNASAPNIIYKEAASSPTADFIVNALQTTFGGQNHEAEVEADNIPASGSEQNDKRYGRNLFLSKEVASSNQETIPGRVIISNPESRKQTASAKPSVWREDDNYKVYDENGNPFTTRGTSIGKKLNLLDDDGEVLVKKSSLDRIIVPEEETPTSQQAQASTTGQKQTSRKKDAETKDAKRKTKKKESKTTNYTGTSSQESQSAQGTLQVPTENNSSTPVPTDSPVTPAMAGLSYAPMGAGNLVIAPYQPPTRKKVELADHADRREQGFRLYPKNTMIQGPIKTGKYHEAITMAVGIIEGKDSNMMNITPVPEILEHYKQYVLGGRILHISYPDLRGDGFEGWMESKGPVVQDGIFKEFSNHCKDGRYVVMLEDVDVNWTRLFGEATVLLRENRREGTSSETTITLPYSGETFQMPSNLFLIATCDSDVCEDMILSAIHQDFYIRQIHPDPSILHGMRVEGILLEHLMETINLRLSYFLGEKYQLGEGFFLGNPDKDPFISLTRIFREQLIPLLEAWFDGDIEKIRYVLGDNAKQNTDTMFYQTIPYQKGLFKGRIPDDFDVDRVIYRLNEKSFKNPKSYLAIYE